MRWALMLAVLWGVSAASVPPARARQAQRKNVVLIVADDHGRDLGCYGNRDVRTPHLDALAAEGTRFEFAFCTTASCSPSRSVILSGLQNHTNGQYGLEHATHKQNSHAWVRGLPNLLRDAGYRTCLVGKYHVAPESSYRFDEVANQGTMGSRHTVRMAENAARFLRQADPRPFFLYFCPTDPHRAGEGFANEREYPGISPARYDPKALQVPHFLPAQPEARRELAEYYAAVSRLDQGVGQLLRALRESGRLEETLVIYASDNGIPFPGAKTTLYEPGIRLPLLVRAPGQRRRGLVCRAMVSWVDLVPTVLQFTGARGPEYPLHGRSFLPLMEESDPPEWDEVYASHQFHEITMYYPMRAVRTRRYKYLRNLAHPLPFPFASDLWNSATWQGVLRRKDLRYGSRTTTAYVQRPQHELYDLEADPRELDNLAARPEHAPILAGLQAKLRAWQQRTGDPWLVKDRHE